MKATAQILFVLGMLLAPVEVIASSCSSYYISEITLVSPGDNEAGRVQTFVGFGASKEEAEKNALGSCSHIQLDLETCLASDRVLDRNAPSDEAKTSLHISTRRRSSASLAAISPTFDFGYGSEAEVATRSREIPLYL